MSWTADNTEIRADQTCWTADGYNGCEDVEVGSVPSQGGTLNFPIGPGFFIFFQDFITGGPHDDIKLDSKRLMEDDNEVIELITLLASCDGLC